MELIAAIVEAKRRNPKFGCVRIVQQISHAFSVDIDKDIVRRLRAWCSIITYWANCLPARRRKTKTLRVIRRINYAWSHRAAPPRAA